jgi:hypothetical protein
VVDAALRLFVEGGWKLLLAAAIFALLWAFLRNPPWNKRR